MYRPDRRARTTDNGRYWSRRLGSMSPSGMTSITGQVHAVTVGPFDQGLDLVLVDALEGHRVDLHAQPRVLRGIDPGQHLREVAPARDAPELPGIERVDRDVHPPHAAIGEFGGEAPELGAVGRQGELVEGARPQVARRANGTAPSRRA